MEKTIKQAIYKRVGQEVDSLTKDGYLVFVRCPLFTSVYIKLRHKANGAIITIVGNYSSRTIMIVRNGRVKKRYNI